MTSRVRGPGSYELLSWGTATDSPGSRVRDAGDRPIFVGTVVANSLNQEFEVVKLVSAQVIACRVVRSSGEPGRLRERQAAGVRVVRQPVFPQPLGGRTF